MCIIENYYSYEGVASVNNNNIKGSFNHSSLDNVTIQSDVLNEYQISEKDFQKLETDINEADISDSTKEQNKMFLENLKTSLNEHDKETAKKMIDWIQSSIGKIASVTTILDALN